MRNIDATITITDSKGRRVELSGSHTYAPATIERVPVVLMGDLPGEGVDTVRWSDPWPMTATLRVDVRVSRLHMSSAMRGARELGYSDREIRAWKNAQPRLRRPSSTESRRARRTAATKRYRLFNRRCR